MKRPSLHPHCKLMPLGFISDWRIRFKARRPGDRVASSRWELHIYQKWTRLPPPVLHEPNVWEILQAVLEENGPTSPRIRVTRFKARRPGDRVASSRWELHIYQKWTRLPPPVLHEPNVWEILQAVLEENGPTSPRIRVTRRHNKAIKGQCREELMVQFKELISMALGSK